MMIIDARRYLFLAVAIWLGTVLFATAAFGGQPINTNWRGWAIKGYDPVAYFTRGVASKGSSEFTLEWQGARWRFATADHRDRFKADPQHYAPRYGGYCAYAVAEGGLADVAPAKAWRIVDGRLYLNYNRKIQSRWEEDIPGYIRKADRNWPGVLE